MCVSQADVGEETITSILIEFANTEAACLTVSYFILQNMLHTVS